MRIKFPNIQGAECVSANDLSLPSRLAEDCIIGGTLGAPAPRNCSEMLTWVDQVVANGGSTPPQPEQDALCDFVAGCKTDGFWSKLIIANHLSNSGLAAMATPIKPGPGPVKWVFEYQGSGSPTLTINGVISNGGHCDMGITVDSFLSDTSAGITAMVSRVKVSGTKSEGFVAGAFDQGASPGFFDLAPCEQGQDRIHADCWNTNDPDEYDVSPVIAGGIGYYSRNRISGTDLRQYYASGTTAHAQVGPTVGATPGFVAPSTNFWFFSCNNRDEPVDGTVSFLAVHLGLTQTESSNFFARIQRLFHARGGGFV